MIITVPGTFKGEGGKRKLEGLCGDYDGNSENEFLGYSSAQDFGNSWKDRDPCTNVPEEEAKFKPCEVSAWSRHDMERLSSLLAICVGNPPVIVGLPYKRPSFEFFFPVSCCTWDAMTLMSPQYMYWGNRIENHSMPSHNPVLTSWNSVVLFHVLPGLWTAFFSQWEILCLFLGYSMFFLFLEDLCANIICKTPPTCTENNKTGLKVGWRFYNKYWRIWKHRTGGFQYQLPFYHPYGVMTPSIQEPLSKHSNMNGSWRELCSLWVS